MMSCHLRSMSLVDDVVGGALDLRSRETCTFLTFGKLPPSTPRPAVLPPATIGNGRVQPAPATNVGGACGTGNSRERKSSTETGPPDPSALRPGSGESTSRARCPSPADVDDDDVFPVADVGCSAIASCRSVSVPPRRTRSCAAQSLVSSEASAWNAATAIKISPPRMKRRKKKIGADSSESESRKVGSSTSSTSNNIVMPFVSRRSKASDVTRQHETHEASNNDGSKSSNGGDGDCLPNERPASERSTGRESSSASMEAETKRKKNIRWKSDVAQSSPDVASDDADSKESGYITLEDLQAQLGLSSWSSDERQTDQDVFSSSGDELRAPEGLHGAQSTSSTSSAFEAPSSTTALLLPLPPSSSFLSPLVPPEQFGALDGVIDCCRSAPPTCDASLLKFTFTVRLDSKMFHRRAAANKTRRDLMIADVRERGLFDTATGRRKELCGPVSSPVPTSGTDGQTGATAVENSSSPTVENHQNDSLPAAASRSSSAQQNTQVSTPAAFATAPPPDCAASSSNSVQPFAGEKMVVTAEVHRSADQLDTDRPKTPGTPTTAAAAVSNGQRPVSYTHLTLPTIYSV